MSRKKQINGATKAERLCKMIEDYWAERGHVVKCSYEDGYTIVSDMIDGYPESLSKYYKRI